MAIKVFCCYARKDEELLRKLRTQLIPLQRRGLIEVWFDGEISAGTKWEAELRKHLNIAQVILFLVSPHFISSDYCYDVEVREAVKRHEKGEARVIPIILSPVHWQETPFGQLQALPKNAKPLTSWRNRSNAIFDIADGIKKVVYELSAHSEAITETTSKPAFSAHDDPNPSVIKFIAETTSKPVLRPDVGDPDSPLEEEKDFNERYDVEEKIFDSDKYKNKSFEERRVLASKLLEKKYPQKALELLSEVNIKQVPMALRWRLVTLRGQCYFNMRIFLQAQQEFRTAHAILPDNIPPDQSMEVLVLLLLLASASRELGQYETAFEWFEDALAHVDFSTSVRFVAEAYWGISLVLYEQAYKRWNEGESGSQQDAKKEFLKLMQQSLHYAENTCILYNMFNELLRSALMNCQIALIEQGMKHLDAARIRLQKVLNDWLPTWQVETQEPSPDIVEKVMRYTVKERANIISAAACYLASVELDARECTTALEYADLALEAGRDSYIVRRADAYMTMGQILAAMDDPRAIDAFQEALRELEQTHRKGAKISIHRMLGAYLIKHGDDRAGNAELDKALRLANVPSSFQIQ